MSWFISNPVSAAKSDTPHFGKKSCTMIPYPPPAAGYFARVFK